ncbi:MAG TPA: short-chain dehydrogenase/reductase [Cytophagales bacterium]|nr:short-chain dehydrogenase/reductase [Cytophagales bacterium]
MQNVWLITGCSTGFGRELCKVVAAKGDIAVGTVRKAEQQAELEALAPDNIMAILLDVAKPDEVTAGVQAALDKYGRIDVLVNNAGYGSPGGLEETPEEEMYRQFEVNVFGAVRMARAVLPAMRKQRKGHILNITSIAGLQGYPGVSIYNGSKFALEGIGEGLAAEVKPLGIHVTNIEPGPFRTDWAGRSATYTPSTIEDYKETVAKNLDSINSVSGTQIGDPIKAAEAMYKVTTLENPPVHLPLGGPAYKRARIKFETILKEVDEFEWLGKPTDYEQV